MLRLTAALTTLILLAGACSSGGSDAPDKPSYSPIPDEQLFSQITRLPGVESADISYNDAFPDNAYVGRVTLAPDADAQRTLDTILAILRQGRPDVDMNIQAQQDGRAVSLDAIDGPTTRGNLEKRYGPQPGDGTPPGD